MNSFEGSLPKDLSKLVNLEYVQFSPAPVVCGLLCMDTMGIEHESHDTV